jgi:hypothetical protein
MNSLCVSTSLTSSELASWVQAIGSILAIGVAVLIAGYQARRQLDSAQRMQAIQQQSVKKETAATLSELARVCVTTLKILSSQVDTREKIHVIAEGDVHFDLEQVKRLDYAIAAIPVQSLPSNFVVPMFLLSSVVRQFVAKIELVFRVHRTMNGDAFADFFRNLDEMNSSISLTSDDILKELAKINVIPPHE